MLRFLWIPLFFTLHIINAQYDFTDLDKSAYKELLALRLDNASEYANRALDKNPNNGISLYLSNYIKVMKIFLSDDATAYKEGLKHQNSLIAKLEAIEGESPYKRFLQAETKLQWAVLKMKFSDEVSGAWELRSAFKLLDENVKKYPEFKPHLKSLGLLHVLVGSVPSNYRWIVSIVGMNGTVSQGMKELNTCIEDKNDFSFETEIYALLIKTYILKKQQQAIPQLERLYIKNPDNLALCLVLGSTMLHNQQSEKAYQILMNRPNSREYYEVPAFTKMIADCHFYALEYTKAYAAYASFLQAYKGENYIKDVYYKMFLLEWFEKNTQNPTYLKNIKTKGKQVFEVDKHAYKYANDIKNQHRVLTQARVLYDGGYFEKTCKILENCRLSDFKLKIHLQEYYYRKGRVYSSLLKTDAAIESYKKAINLYDEKQNTYFAPNACLQLGYIYIDRYDKVKAKFYFTKSIDDYQGHEYESSIENKAKAALDNLKQ